ncbi:hypothetical protein [Metasolibacillus sp.]|uniref:hypothetical protein n=1 Tax=Metasolibacillus sp. TaxID=2703680 RepID=UPI0025F11BC2|nr:hypothetical protein [Metasolibacillus sp.]MCT6924670.1 hypothetical protein [Metasolibacillus sp.]MCT6940872.1 hypothetical protein [Metasolibacillus sp.]
MKNNKFLYLVIILTVLFLCFPNNMQMTSATFSNNINHELNGEIIIKYSAPDMDWKNATEHQKQILTKIGWEIENDIPVLYRKTSDILRNNNHNHNSLNTPTIHHEKHGMKISVNNKIQQSFDGKFHVDEKHSQVFIEIDGFNNKVQVQKNSEGIFQAIIELNLSEIIDSMSYASYNVGAVPLFSPPPHGTYKYQVGDQVHCNRFNGPYTDHYHYAKTHPQAYINFYMSDCEHGVAAFICNSYGNDPCNRDKQLAYCSLMIYHITRYHLH